MEMRGGLRLPQTSGTGVGETEGQEIHNEWNTIDWAKNMLYMEYGVAPPEEPDYECPVIEPGTLATMSSQDYTTVYEKTLGHFGHLSERLAEAKAMVLQCDNEMRYIDVITRKRMREDAEQRKVKKPTSDQLTESVETNPRYVELWKMKQKWTQLRDLLSGRVDTLEANLKTISRHIEIRKLDREGHNRGHNMPSRGREMKAGMRT